MKLLDNLEYEITGSSLTTVKFKGYIKEKNLIGKVNGFDVLKAISLGCPFGGSCHLNPDGSFSGEYFTD